MGLDEMPPTLRGRFSTDGKRTQKGAQKASPFLYIYSLERVFFGMVLGMGGGTVKVDSPKRRGRARGKTTDIIILKFCACVNNFMSRSFSIKNNK